MDEQQCNRLLTLAEDAAVGMQGPDQGIWRSRLEAEHTYLQRAVSWSIERQETEQALRLCAALHPFWLACGHAEVGLKLSRSALALEYESGPNELLARVLNNAGVLARTQGDYQAARTYHEQSLAMRREIGDAPGIASSFTGLGNVANALGDYAAARNYYEQSMAIKREIGDMKGVGGSLNNLGFVAYRQGDYTSAQRYYEQSLEIWRSFSNRQHIALSLQGFAEVASAQACWNRAVKLFAAAEALREQSRTLLPTDEHQALNQDLASARNAIGTESFSSAWETGRSMTMDQAITLALHCPNT